jgi:hypothetical protein
VACVLVVGFVLVAISTHVVAGMHVLLSVTRQVCLVRILARISARRRTGELRVLPVLMHVLHSQCRS